MVCFKKIEGVKLNPSKVNIKVDKIFWDFILYGGIDESIDNLYAYQKSSGCGRITGDAWGENTEELVKINR